MSSFADLATGGPLPADVDEFAALKDCPQDPVVHAEGSVWNHTELALETFDRDTTLTGSDREAARLAVAFHDIGKPDTTGYTGAGRLHAPGHAQHSARIFNRLAGLDPYLRSLPYETRAQIWASVTYHDLLWRSIDVPHGEWVRLSHLVSPNVFDAVVEADAHGRICRDPHNVDAALELMKLARADAEADVSAARPHLPDGTPPRVARELLWAQARGEVANRWEAEAFVARRREIPTSTTVVYTVGLPGVGKSTFSEELAAAGFAHYTVTGNRRRDRRRSRTELFDGLANALSASQPVVLDATWLSRRQRAVLTAQAYRYAASLVCVVFDFPLSLSLERNRTRPWRDTVPSDAIREMAEVFEYPDPSEYDTFVRVSPSTFDPARAAREVQQL